MQTRARIKNSNVEITSRSATTFPNALTDDDALWKNNLTEVFGSYIFKSPIRSRQIELREQVGGASDVRLHRTATKRTLDEVR